ncbi:helix-turn-helix domain-containing protein [Polaribacter sp. Q13]|uniref:helix-turn-helix domain-containing protein n=1 Tax=Polaribacter sp. Q13 TaxID=2806551 RepID=UPI00267724E4|nr:helix-turn-helix domain-containing protein [Polaribacter sp. Q13]
MRPFYRRYLIDDNSKILHQMDKSIAEVTYALGFNEVANFNQFFKRNLGVTATQFRNKEH